MLLIPVLLSALELGAPGTSPASGLKASHSLSHRLSPTLPLEAPWLERLCFTERQ